VTMSFMGVRRRLVPLSCSTPAGRHRHASCASDATEGAGTGTLLAIGRPGAAANRPRCLQAAAASTRFTRERSPATWGSASSRRSITRNQSQGR